MARMTEPVPTPRYQRLVAAASEIATDWGHQYVGTEHLFLAIIGDRDAVPTQVLARLTDVDRVGVELRALMESDGYRPGVSRVAAGAAKLVGGVRLPPGVACPARGSGDDEVDDRVLDLGVDLEPDDGLGEL